MAPGPPAQVEDDPELSGFNFSVPPHIVNTTEDSTDTSSSADGQVKKHVKVPAVRPLHIGGGNGGQKRGQGTRGRPSKEAGRAGELAKFTAVFAEAMEKSREQAEKLAMAAQVERALDRAERVLDREAAAALAREERQHQLQMAQSCRMQ